MAGPLGTKASSAATIYQTSELVRTDDEAASEYRYSPLSEQGSIRLLRLMPHEDEKAVIQCQLFEYPLQKLAEGTHLYEALSYVWGSDDNRQPVYIQSDDRHSCPSTGSNRRLLVTPNLHAALSHLRERHLAARILWVDAICINQRDKDEKGRQVQSMAKIFAVSRGVVVWLGEAADNSHQALQVIRKAAEKRHTDSPIDRATQQATLQQATPPARALSPSSSHSSPCSIQSSSSPAAESSLVSDKARRELRAYANSFEQVRLQQATLQQAILTLLERPWFQRIWVLQEVAAARHILIKCGHMEIDGYAFCLGLSALKLSYEKYADLRGLIPSIVYLISSAIFRPKYGETSRLDRFSLDIRPLSELVDMYHTRKATYPLDKVYALLGMSSDDPDAAGLSPNYNTSWKTVFQNLVKFSLSDRMSVDTWDGKEVAVIEGKGYVLGEVSSFKRDGTQGDRQSVSITWKSHFNTKGEQDSHFAFPVSAKSIQVGDAVCLLQGASKPTIVRPCNGYSAIIMIAVPLPDDIQPTFQSITTFPNDVLLVWDWDVSQRKSQDGRDYELLISNRQETKCPKTECKCQDYLDEAIRLWNFGLLLNGMERYEEAIKNIRKALEVYGMALRSVGNSHGLWREADDETRRVMDDLLIEDKGATMEAKYKEYGQTPLFWAAERGHEAIVKLLLEKGADTESKDRGGQTLLSYAAAGGHEAVVKLLIEKGAGAESKDRGGRTPLSYAAAGGHEAVVKLLFEKGADAESKNRRGRTPLSYAAAGGHEAVVKLLGEKGADAESKDRDGRTPLSYATAGGHEAVVKLLLEKGADAELKDEQGRMPLSYATAGGHEAVVKLLVEKGADAQSKDRDGWTPLGYAAAGGYEVVVKLLLEKGADAELKNRRGRTLLSYAAAGGHKAVVKLLLEKGADAESKDELGQTPLSYAAAGGHEAVVKLLFEKGADAESKNRRGRTPLSYAAEGGHEAVVKLLVEKGADAKLKDKDGWMPLSYAAAGGHEAVIKLLVEKGTDVESKDRDGRTPLSYAAAGGHKAIVKLLFEKGADAESKNEWGRTPLSYAAEGGHETIVMLLVEKGADIESKNRDGRMPLLYAAAGGHEAVVKLLVEKGADTESKDKDGWTPLSYAAAGGHEAIVKLLFKKGTDVKSKAIGGWTPLLYAASRGHEAVVKLLVEKGADAESKDRDGRTLLSYAAAGGYEAIVKLLFEKGTNAESKDRGGRTPLSYTVARGHEAVVKLLFEKGADAESKDLGGRTPLSYATAGGHEAVVKLLLEKGADVESKTIGGRTPLSYAAAGGHEAVVKLLGEKGADAESKDRDGQTPLSYAATRGHKAIVKLLESHSAQSPYPVISTPSLKRGSTSSMRQLYLKKKF